MSRFCWFLISFKYSRVFKYLGKLLSFRHFYSVRFPSRLISHLFIFLLLSSPFSVWAENTPKIQLTAEEQAWLAEHPDVTFGFTDSFEPFLIRGVRNQHIGILVDLLKELNSQLGTNFMLEVDSWPVILEKVKQKEMGAVLGVAHHTADSFGLLKTVPYYTVYPAFFAREDAPFAIKSLDDLRGKSVAILDKAKVMADILEPYGSDVKISRHPDNLTALQMVFEGKMDLAFGLSTHSYYINKYGLLGVKPVHTLLERPSKVGIAVRTDWPELIPILNKAIVALQQVEFPRIIDKWFVNRPQQSEASVVQLTPEEQAWLSEHPVVQTRFHHHPPYMYLEDGQTDGLTADLLDRISELVGIKFEIENIPSRWSDDLERLIQQEELDLLPSIMATPAREKDILFTEPYINSPRFIFTRVDSPFIASIDELDNKSIAVVQNYAVHRELEEKHPDFQLLKFVNVEMAIRAVSSGEADAFIGDLISTPALINELGLLNLKAASPSDLSDHPLSMGVRKDWPEFRDILDKALKAIPADEKAALMSKWSTVKIDYGIKPSDILRWGLIIVVAAFGIVLVFMFWNKQLSRKVEERTSQLMESESRFRATFEQAAVGVAHVSLEGKFIRVNRKFCDIAGYSEEEMLDLTFQDITHPDDLDTDLELVEQVLNGKRENYSLEKRYLRKDGSYVWINLSVSLLFDKGGNPKYFVSVIKDISKRKAAEESLQQSYDFQEHLNTSVPDAIFSIKMPERIVEWANDSYKILGYEPEECIGKSTEMFYASPEEYNEVGALLANVIEEERNVLNTEVLLRRKNGEVFTAEVSVSVFRENGKVSGVTALARDITERKQAEAELHKSYKEIEELQKQLQAESAYLQEEIRLDHNFENIIGNSNAIQYALFKVEQVAETDSTVLILGETGTGKELVARAIHHNSQRKDRPLVKINCATLPANLIESELFGHEKGSFTGAVARHTGRFEVADGSTLFLDEIGEMPIELQSKLLRAIEDGEFERLGSTRTIKVDVRIIAATNRNLEQDVKEGRFRQDLWYRLNVFPITLPPLRDRLEDIPQIVQYYLEIFTRKMGKKIDSIPAKVMKSLQSYTWPGNVRELQNVLERAVISSPGSKLQLAEMLSQSDQEQSQAFKSLRDMERDYIVSVLESTGWKVSGKNSAAEVLGLDRSTLRARMKKLGISKAM